MLGSPYFGKVSHAQKIDRLLLVTTAKSGMGRYPRWYQYFSVILLIAPVRFSSGCSHHLCVPIEKQVRAAGNKKEAVEAIAKDWGLECP